MPARTRRPSTRDLVVPCSGGGHRVRLAGGLRFFASARCPRCRAPVDPLRWRRIWTWMRGLTRPASPHVADRVLHAASAGWVVVIGLAAILLWGLADVWWPATVLLFGPRWVLVLPAIVLIPWAALRDRDWLVPLAVAAAVGLGPLVGLQTGVRSVLPAGEGLSLRVATLNAWGGDRVDPLARMLAAWNADVVVLQECGGRLREQVRAQAVPGSPLSVHIEETLCLVSRMPLIETAAMERDAFELANGSGLVHSYLLDWAGDTIAVTNVHLETQREGLELFRRGRISDAIPRLKQKSVLRSIEHRVARRWAESHGHPAVVAGDFNTPPESRAYRAEWDGWTDAFAARGRGMGATRMNGWIQARIDYVLADARWRVVSVEVGDDVGSDHLPVIAELRRR
ncbi:MAG: endonuclease/exonuclease/phosphatase family protein [Gemmatimonadetes bacterium]|nr:endonuclease/exonuclease/phosphatase family protein [Gemmatimonadota bacterium]